MALSILCLDDYCVQLIKPLLLLAFSLYEKTCRYYLIARCQKKIALNLVSDMASMSGAYRPASALIMPSLPKMEFALKYIGVIC